MYRDGGKHTVGETVSVERWNPGGDSECREIGHRHMVGETVSVERWGRHTVGETVSVKMGAQTYGGGDSECREMGADIRWGRQ